MIKRFYITGSKGQISLELRKLLSKKSLKVVILSKTKPKLFKNEEYIFFNLKNKFLVPKKSNNIIFHLAHDFKDAENSNKNINYIGAKNLISSFKNEPKTKFVYFSTLNTSDVGSTYQNQKLLIERLFAKETSLIIRMSLVFTPNEGVNSILSKARFFPIPIPSNKNYISPIDNIDLCIESLRFVNEEFIGCVCVLGKEDMTFKDFLIKYHKVRSFYLNNFFFDTLNAILSRIVPNSSFYLRERICGLQNIKNIRQLTEGQEISRI